MEDTLILQFASSPLVNWLAMINSVIYVVLAARLNIWCWLAGFFTSFFYTFIFIYLQLYSQIALNVAYMIFAVFGWAMWSESRKHHEPSVVKVWSYRTHAIFGGVIFLLSWMAPNIMVNWLSQEQAFLDVLLVVASLLATTLTVFRVLESWLYWIVINLLSIYLYWQQGDWMTIMLFSIYASFAVYGWIYWRKIRKQDLQQFNQGVTA